MRSTLLAILVLTVCFHSQGGTQTVNESNSSQKRHLYVVGVSHLDTQWRWTIQNTINEFVPATFADNFKLMDIYPDYIFSFEGAFRYMLLREYYPDLYERLKPYVASGRWRVAGSWVDAADVNMPSFESLVRHCLYGNGFFKQEFGKTSRDVLLPDCFGFGYALPSVAAHCGLKSFSTQKLSWGSSVGVPFDIGVWEGVDGSSLVAALRPGDYVSKIKGDLSKDTLWLGRIDRQGSRSGLYAAYMYFGTGDTGGTPDSASVARLHDSQKSDGPITVKSIGSDDLVGTVVSGDQSRLPHYKGELLMTRHGVGCYTSQAAMKRWNRKNELLADAAERASVIADLLGGATYPRAALNENWIRFLWHQFHDDLTGTSIPEAYEFSWNDEILCLNRFAGILENAVAATTPALDTRVKGIALAVFNPLSIAREDIVEATVAFPQPAPKNVSVYGPDGKEVPSQVVETYGDSLKILFLAKVPSVGYAAYDIRPAKTPCSLQSGLKITRTTLENKRYAVRLDENGDVASIFDKSHNRELLAEPIRLELLHDKPKQWPAWEIQYEDIMAPPRFVSDAGAEIRIAESGPARVGLEIIRRTENSVFRTVIRLSAGSAGERVEFDSDVDWYEQETLLKAAFKLTVPNDSATYDIGLGSVRRGINRAELYEVPGHQWADMTSETGDYGVAVLNDCKYGWDHPDKKTLRLTLVHTPGVFENWSWVGDQRSQDKGHHKFLYAICGHPGDWREGSVPWQAARLNQPLLAFQTAVHKGKLGKEFSLLSLDGGAKGESMALGEPTSVMVNAVKLAENSDEIIIRLKEAVGRSNDDVRIRLNWPIAAAREVNGIEETVGVTELRDGVLRTKLAPYQPRAFAVTLEKVKSRLVSLPVCQTLQLPFNCDGISLDANRRDGDFDGNGNTLSGDLLPDTLTYLDLPFVFGPEAARASNAVKCMGQKLAFPASEYNRLYLLATAVGGPAEGSFLVDGKETRVAIQDYAEPLGQWNNRLGNGSLVEEASGIAPAYTNRAPVAWVGTHRHTARGENEAYRFTYLYAVRLDLPKGATSVTLPDNRRIVVLAATLARTESDKIKAAQPLYDVATATLTKIHAERSSFLDSTTLTITSPIPRAAIRYTLDGSDPTPNSPLYAEPIAVGKTTTVKSRAFLEGVDDNHVTAAVFTKLVPREPAKLSKTLPGLQCSYYEGTWSKLPHFDSLSADRRAVMDSVAIPDFARKEDYGLVFSGFVQIPQDGLYSFFIDSDDGSALWVGDSLLADNDGIHGSQEVSGEIALKAGLHPIAVYMFQAKGGQYLRAAVQGPELEKRPIPPSMLFREAKGAR